VNYAPNAHDNDHRLVAESGAFFRGTFASNVQNPRYISQLTLNALPPDTAPPNISITAPQNNSFVTTAVQNNFR
jgi:hypothetical protein